METAKSEGKIKPEDKIAVNQKSIQKWEVDKLLGHNPVNLVWRFFNQSLLWFILAILIFTAISNFSQTGSIAQAPPKTIPQILESKYWSPEEEKLVIEKANDEDFLIFLSKFKSENLAKKALRERLKIRKLKPNSIPSLENSENANSSISNPLSSNY